MFGVVVWTGLATAALGQSGSGELVGRVVDASGAAVAGAQVRLTERSTGVVQTGAVTRSGDYAFVALRPGSYGLSVSAAGFGTVERTAVTVATGERVGVDVRLAGGGGNEAVDGAAGAPPVASDSGAVGVGRREQRGPGR